MSEREFTRLVDRLRSILNLVPRAFPLKVGGAEKTLASAGHVSILHPEILGVIN